MEDHELRRLARKRAGFKRHLYIYVIVNIFLVLTNFFTSPMVPWSAGPLLGWGLGLAFHGLFAYRAAPGTLEEKEFEKLKKRQDGG